jgi:hypothetical protein
MRLRQSTIVTFILLIACHAPRLFAQAMTQPYSTPVPAFDPSGVKPLLRLEDDDDDDDKPKSGTLPTTDASSGRYFFGLLDHRSSYGKDFFPDPFLGPEFDIEKQLEFDYGHGEKRGYRNDEIDAGFQWNVVGQLMVAGDFGWSNQHDSGSVGDSGGDDGGGSATNSNGSGVDDVTLAVYHPVFQYVSEDGSFDYTAAARLDVDIPTHTPVSGTDVLLTPYLGQLIRLGDHVSVETWTGSQFTIAPHQTTQFIYGGSLGYALPHSQLPLPFTESTTPLIELDGQTAFSGAGQDSLFGVAGFAWEMKVSGDVQPAIEIGYQFPLDQGAGDQLDWAIVASFFLQF